MSLVGAKFVCLDETGARSKVIEANGRKFTVGYYASCDYILVDARAKGVHCEIQMDAFGRVTIHNMSEEHPISINGNSIGIKRPLLNGTRINILDKQFLWEFPKSSSNEYEDIPSEHMSTPQKQVGIPEQPPNSCPDFKLHRLKANRFTVHNFAYCIQSDEEGNSSSESIEDNISEQPSLESVKEVNSDAETALHMSSTPDQRSVTPEPAATNPLIQLEHTPTMNLINCTQNKENKSSQKKRSLLALCQQSDMVITSFSPRETGVRIEKSFTAILKAKTPKSVYSTPRGVLSELEDDGSRDFIDFSTPATSRKAMHVTNSSMHLIDLTTPSKLRPTSPYTKSALKSAIKKHANSTLSTEQLGLSALPVTPTVGDDTSHIQTPHSVASVISVDSTSDASSSVIEVSTDEPTPSLSSATTSKTLTKTPSKTNLLRAGVTPRRTPAQSLMKRAILTSAKKASTPRQFAMLTPPSRKCLNSTASQERTPASSSVARQSLTTPSRKTSFSFATTPGAASTSFAAKRAAHALMASTPHSLSKLRNNTAADVDRTTSLHKVRKSLGGTTLSSHISKVRKSILIANRLSPTSGGGSSSAQRFATERKSLCATPANTRARIMVASVTPTAKTANSKVVQTQSARKPIEQLKATHPPKDNLSRTFILDDEKDEKVKEKEKEQTKDSIETTKPKDVTFSPVKDGVCSVLNKTFSPVKEKSIAVENVDTPVDVAEVKSIPTIVVDECIAIDDEYENSIDSSADIEAVIDVDSEILEVSLARKTPQEVDESFAEIIDAESTTETKAVCEDIDTIKEQIETPTEFVPTRVDATVQRNKNIDSQNATNDVVLHALLEEQNATQTEIVELLADKVNEEIAVNEDLTAINDEGIVEAEVSVASVVNVIDKILVEEDNEEVKESDILLEKTAIDNVETIETLSEGIEEVKSTEIPEDFDIEKSEESEETEKLLEQIDYVLNKSDELEAKKESKEQSRSKDENGDTTVNAQVKSNTPVEENEEFVDDKCVEILEKTMDLFEDDATEQKTEETVKQTAEKTAERTVEKSTVGEDDITNVAVETEFCENAVEITTQEQNEKSKNADVAATLNEALDNQFEAESYIVDAIKQPQAEQNQTAFEVTIQETPAKLSAPKRAQLSTPQYTGMRRLLRTPKTKHDETNALEDVHLLLKTPQQSGKLNDAETPSSSSAALAEKRAFTPLRRSARRASLTADVKNNNSSSNLTPQRMTRARRASLSADASTAVTPKRITKRRPSMSLDETEATATVVTKQQKTPRARKITISDDNVEDMGAIVEEESFKETSPTTVLETDNETMIATESVLEIAGDEEASDQITSVENVVEPISVPECLVKEHDSTELRTSKEEHNLTHAAEAVNDSEVVCIVEDKSLCEVVEHDDAAASSSIKNEKVHEIPEDLTEKVRATLNDAADYDYGSEVVNTKEETEEFVKTTDKAPSTPKPKKALKIKAQTPKTPFMSGMRELMQTPKPTAATPKYAGLRDLVRTPKQHVDDIEKDENKFEGLDELVKTPKVEVKHELKTDNECMKTQLKLVEEEDVEENPCSSTQAKNVYTGMREMLQTPKTCVTPHMKGLREMLSTPKYSSTPLMGGVKELLHTPKMETTVDAAFTTITTFTANATLKEETLQIGNTTTLESSNQTADVEGLDKFFTTPRAKNAMIPSLPASAAIEKCADSVELTAATEYSLHATSVGNLEDIFKTSVDTRITTLTDDVTVDDEHIEDACVELESPIPQNLSGEEAFDALTGQNSLVNKTPDHKTYVRKSTVHTVPPSPFSAGDIISDLPKTDIQEWVDSLEEIDSVSESLNQTDEQEVTFDGAALEQNDADLSRDPFAMSAVKPQVPATSVKVFVPHAGNKAENDGNSTTASEHLVNVSSVSSHVDPLNATLAIAADAANDELSSVEQTPLADTEISGIDLLDETAESDLFEPLLVSDSDSVEEITEQSAVEIEANENLCDESVENVETNEIDEFPEILIVSGSENLNNTFDKSTEDSNEIVAYEENLTATDDIRESSVIIAEIAEQTGSSSDNERQDENADSLSNKETNTTQDNVSNERDEKLELSRTNISKDVIETEAVDVDNATVNERKLVAELEQSEFEHFDENTILLQQRSSTPDKLRTRTKLQRKTLGAETDLTITTTIDLHLEKTKYDNEKMLLQSAVACKVENEEILNDESNISQDKPSVYIEDNSNIAAIEDTQENVVTTTDNIAITASVVEDANNLQQNDTLEEETVVEPDISLNTPVAHTTQVTSTEDEIHEDAASCSKQIETPVIVSDVTHEITEDHLMTIDYEIKISDESTQSEVDQNLEELDFKVSKVGERQAEKVLGEPKVDEESKILGQLEALKSNESQSKIDEKLEESVVDQEVDSTESKIEENVQVSAVDDNSEEFSSNEDYQEPKVDEESKVDGNLHDNLFDPIEPEVIVVAEDGSLAQSDTIETIVDGNVEDEHNNTHSENVKALQQEEIIGLAIVETEETESGEQKTTEVIESFDQSENEMTEPSESTETVTIENADALPSITTEQSAKEAVAEPLNSASVSASVSIDQQSNENTSATVVTDLAQNIVDVPESKNIETESFQNAEQSAERIQKEQIEANNAAVKDSTTTSHLDEIKLSEEIKPRRRGRKGSNTSQCSTNSNQEDKLPKRRVGRRRAEAKIDVIEETKPIEVDVAETVTEPFIESSLSTEHIKQEDQANEVPVECKETENVADVHENLIEKNAVEEENNELTVATETCTDTVAKPGETLDNAASNTELANKRRGRIASQSSSQCSTEENLATVSKRRGRSRKADLTMVAIKEHDKLMKETTEEQNTETKDTNNVQEASTEKTETQSEETESDMKVEHPQRRTRRKATVAASSQRENEKATKRRGGRRNVNTPVESTAVEVVDIVDEQEKALNAEEQTTNVEVATITLKAKVKKEERKELHQTTTAVVAPAKEDACEENEVSEETDSNEVESKLTEEKEECVNIPETSSHQAELISVKEEAENEETVEEPAHKSELKTKRATKRRIAQKETVENADESSSSKRRAVRKRQPRQDFNDETVVESKTEETDSHGPVEHATTKSKKRAAAIDTESKRGTRAVRLHKNEHSEEKLTEDSTAGSNETIESQPENNVKETHASVEPKAVIINEFEHETEEQTATTSTKKQKTATAAKRATSSRRRGKDKHEEEEAKICADIVSPHVEAQVSDVEKTKLQEHENVETKKQRGRKRKESLTEDKVKKEEPQPESPAKRTRKASIDADTTIPATAVNTSTETATATSATKSPRERLRRAAAAAEHNYDESSDTEIAYKRIDAATTSRGRTRKPTARVQQYLEEERAKAETPKKRLLLSDISSPTPQKQPARRGRKPSTIETNVLGGDTPQIVTKQAALLLSETIAATPISQKMPGRRGRKPSTIETDITNTPKIVRRGRGARNAVDTTEPSQSEEATQSSPQTEEEHKVVKGRARIARGKAKQADEHVTADEPASKKSAVEIIVEKAETPQLVATAITPEPTKRGGRARRVAALIKGSAATPTSVETDNSTDLDEEKPKATTRGRAVRGRSAKATKAAKHEQLEAEAEDEADEEEENEPLAQVAEKVAAAAIKRTAAAADITSESPAMVKRGGRRKVAVDSVAEPAAEPSSTTVAATTKPTRGGRSRKVVRFEPTNEAATSASTIVAATTDAQVALQTVEVDAPAEAPPKRATRTRRK